MRVRVKKLYRGCVEVRDYVVQRCVMDNEELTIEYPGGEITLSPSELWDRAEYVTGVQRSKYGRDYRLIAFKVEV